MEEEEGLEMKLVLGSEEGASEEGAMTAGEVAAQRRLGPSGEAREEALAYERAPAAAEGEGDSSDSGAGEERSLGVLRAAS